MEKSRLEEKKKSNVGLIVLLVAIIVGLAGYICYDKLYMNRSIDVNNKKRKKALTEDEELEKDLLYIDSMQYNIP